MKNNLLFTCLLLLCASFAFSQTTPSKTADKKTKAKTETTSPATGPTKKDGTPDKRYKANKGAKTPTQHLKKDGTPDKRFKENKDQKTADPVKKS